MESHILKMRLLTTRVREGEWTNEYHLRKVGEVSDSVMAFLDRIQTDASNIYLMFTVSPV